MKEYVFLSYKSEEKETALNIKRILEANGIECWMAPESLQIGSVYSAEITKAISNCKAFILVLSHKSQESVYVRKELDLAIGKNKPVYPFAIENTVLNDSFSFYLQDIQIYSAFSSWESSLEKLVRAIRYLFESIGVEPNPDTVLRDPIKIMSALPHHFDPEYILFGRYKVIELLQVYDGNQQFYSAIDMHTCRTVLIKYIDRTLPHRELSFGISTAGTFFQHPYIASPIDEYSNESYFVHIEPFYEVHSLDTIIESEGPQDYITVLKWAIPICEAMIYMNEDMGYFYGQMGAQNIRIQNNGLPILFDVSLAVPLSCKTNSFFGNIGRYYPGKAFGANVTIDIYALGANMFYALTGCYFHGLERDITILQNQHNIPKPLIEIIQKCLSPFPEKRYQSFKELLYDLEYYDKQPKKSKTIWTLIGTQ